MAVLRHAQQSAAARASLRTVGALLPPWLLDTPQKRPTAAVLRELAETLDGSRESREYEMRARLVRAATQAQYKAMRAPPESRARGDVSHVISARDACRLRDGLGLDGVLVLDPSPALLTAAELAEARDELQRIVQHQTQESINPCNRGSWHGYLQLDSAPSTLGRAATLLLERFAALPALVSRVGWRRRLCLPPAVMLGYYPADTGAMYRKHLDRQPTEAENRREITFLVYVNCGWDVARCGGCLRLHSNDAVAPVDVEPIGGRVVVFRSADQLHEVLPSTGEGRIALTLWVEYEEDG